MGMYWLLDRLGHEGATALVETDGSMHVINVHRFGPGITELDEQQAIWDDVIGHIAPTLKPMVDATTLDEDGVEPDPDLQRGGDGSNRAGRRSAARQDIGGGRSLGGPSKKRSRGDR